MSRLTQSSTIHAALGAALLAVAACGESSSADHTVPDAAVDAAGADRAVADAGDAADAPSEISCNSTAGQRDASADAAPDADPGCWYRLPCGIQGTGMEVVGCELYSVEPPDASLAERALGCWLEPGDGCDADAYAPGPNGGVTIECKECLGGGGRRPRGLRGPASAPAPTALGAYFARMAFEEAASVLAFERMRDELTRFRAPTTLIRAADRARRDEVRHARAMARLARRHGAAAPAPRLRRSRRSLEAMARENAVEGCVHETWGALLLAWQARFAPDASLRRTLAPIAADEARHAALAWWLAEWAAAHLDAPAVARVRRARHRALTALCARLAHAPPEPFDRDAGRPTPDQAVALLDALAARLS